MNPNHQNTGGMSEDARMVCFSGGKANLEAPSETRCPSCGFLPRRWTVAILAGLVIPLGWSTSGIALAERVEGFTEPYRQIDLAAASESGLITSINVREGQQVRQGDLLATLDADVLVATLEIARERARLTGRIDGAKAELELRRRRLAKLRELLQEGHATEGEIERAEADWLIAQANLLLADEERRLAALECKRIEAQIERRYVRTPIDAVVTQVHREVGEAVVINDPRLVTLVQLDPLRVKFSLSVQQASRITQGQVLPLLLTDLGQAAQGSVEIISPVLDAKSGTVQVTCVIENGEDAYRSGMRCVLNLPDAKPSSERAAQSASTRYSR